jgi:hypothetical protein
MLAGLIAVASAYLILALLARKPLARWAGKSLVEHFFVHAIAIAHSYLHRSLPFAIAGI